MKFRVDVFIRSQQWAHVGKRQLVAYAPNADCVRVFVKAWADGEGYQVVRFDAVSID